jgi:hypothetical protein
VKGTHTSTALANIETVANGESGRLSRLVASLSESARRYSLQAVQLVSRDPKQAKVDSIWAEQCNYACIIILCIQRHLVERPKYHADL